MVITRAARPRSTSVSELQERLRTLKLERPPEKAVRPTKRRWVWAIVALVLAIVGGGVYSNRTAPESEANGSVSKLIGMLSQSPQCQVIVATADNEPDFVLETTGFLTPKTKIHLSPSVPGRIVELPIREGQRIRKDDVIVRIDDGQYRADLQQAKAGLELAEAQLRQMREGSRKEDIAQAQALVEQAKARRDLMTAEMHRAEFLKDTISTAEYDKAKASKHEAVAYLDQMEQALHLTEGGPRQSQLEVAQAEVDRAKAVVAKAQYWFDHTVVKAPVDGTVLQKSGELGEYVRPESLVQGLCVMADLRELEAEVDVQERDVGLIKVGQPCRITTDAHEGKIFDGSVARLLPIASRQRGAVAVRIVVRNPTDELLPEMNCRVVFLRGGSSSQPNVPIRLPKLAVAKDGQDAFVFVLHDAVARKTPVRLGATNDDVVEIKEGLHPGDRVLIAPGVALRDGQQVSINTPPADHP